MSHVEELLKTARPNFQEFKRLTASCPKCGAQMILKYASNPRHSRKLSVILCCSNNCDTSIWNQTTTDAKAFTHWWLDGIRNREGYDEIVKSLPEDERKFVQELAVELLSANLWPEQVSRY